jgi:leucine dehydrogenase
MFEDLIRGWNGEQVVVRFDDQHDAWMLVGVHSTVLGPAMGGTRMKVYEKPDDGMRDVLRLSGAMTLKNAAAGLPFGGGKAVLAVEAIPQGDDRRRLLERYAELLASLGGTYVTACDMNTTVADMDVIAERCPSVLGRSPGNGGSGSSAPATAIGVFHGIRACLSHSEEDGLAGRTVVVQGAGAVGTRLSALLSDAGASVLIADPVADRVRDVVGRTGAREVAVAEAIEAPCDVFSPCATGAVLSEETIPRLQCSIVAGAANNQLAKERDAERLRAAGILYAPDFVVNAGGVLSLAGLETLDWTQEELDRRLRGIGDTLRQVFTAAEEAGVSTDAAARRLAEDRIAASLPSPAASAAT